MTPLDVTDYTAQWDCVVPAREVASLRASSTATRAMQRYVFPGAVMVAILSAMISSGILLSVASIVAISSLASVLYRRVHGHSERERHTQRLIEQPQIVVYRSDIEHSAESGRLFREAIDSADALHSLIQGKAYMENFADADMINDALYQCADALRAGTHEGRLRAQEIIANLSNAAVSAAEITRSLEHRRTLTDSAPQTTHSAHDHSAQLSQNMDTLRASAEEIANIHENETGPDAGEEKPA